MLEDKIEELKNAWLSESEEIKEKRIKTIVDLSIDAFIDDNLFSSELDKINFYREIENIRTLEELEIVKKDFFSFNENLSESVKNFFDLLYLKIIWFAFKINSFRKVWINYQIDFFEESNLDDLKKFLQLDREVKFQFVDAKKLRSSVKNFENTEKFVEYLLKIFKWENISTKKKIKLKK